MRFIADDNYVNVIGRTLMYDGTRYLGHSCSAIEFIFTGTKAEAVLWTNSPSLEDIYKAWVAVFVDDEEIPSKRFSLEQNEDIYLLYEGNTVKETKIRLVKCSEVAFGKVGIQSIMVDGSLTPKATEKRTRKLEFIGDSITCGYGIEGVWNTDVFNTTQENPWEAYAAKTARALAADYHLISWSGIGIISNWTNDDNPVDDWLMPDMYPYTDRATDLVLGHTDFEIWDSKRFVPDCIIIHLGSNDASYTKAIPERVERFGTEYHKFVKTVRASNPGTKILCVLGVMGQDLYAEIKRQVNILTSEGEEQIYYMAFDVQDEKDGIGADWHPSKVTHAKMAINLEGKLKEILGW